jgi:hypothetical protein
MSRTGRSWDRTCTSSCSWTRTTIPRRDRPTRVAPTTWWSSYAARSPSSAGTARTSRGASATRPLLVPGRGHDPDFGGRARKHEGPQVLRGRRVGDRRRPGHRRFGLHERRGRRCAGRRSRSVLVPGRRRAPDAGRALDQGYSCGATGRTAVHAADGCGPVRYECGDPERPRDVRRSRRQGPAARPAGAGSGRCGDLYVAYPREREGQDVPGVGRCRVRGLASVEELLREDPLTRFACADLHFSAAS